MKDEELFELCKEVYKRFTEWTTGEWIDHYEGRFTIYKVEKDTFGDYSCPLYTSDYLAEKLKLPYQIESHKHQHDRENLGYENYHIVAWPDKPGIDFVSVDGDTMLKALLKLVLELNRKELL